MRTEDEYMAARDRGQRNLSIPQLVRDWDYQVTTVRTGEEVLTAAELTQQAVIADPTLLLSSDEAYGGGSSLKIDPFHPAARALIALRLAAGTGDEETLEAAIAMAADALDEHGVPPEIADVYAIGNRAENFDPIDVVGSLYVPSTEERQSLWARIRRRPLPTVTASEWAARADAAYTMIGARVGMPGYHRARPVVSAYAEALANPAVPAAIVVERGVEVGQILTDQETGAI